MYSCDCANAGKAKQERSLSGSGAQWWHCADTAPESCGGAKARGARGNLAWFGGRAVAPPECVWPWASPVNSEPGGQTQRRQQGLSGQPGRPAGLGAGLASQDLSPGTSGTVTMARSPETGAAMVAGADCRLAETAVPNRPGHAAISRNDLPKSLHSGARRPEERADGAFAHQTATAAGQGWRHQKWSGADC